MKYLKINHFGSVLFLCGLNLLIMHYYFLFSDYIEDEMNSTTIVDNILGIVIDLTVLLLFSYLVTWKHLKTGLTITFFITLLWSFSNILYSRFFHHYISLSAVGQGGTVFDPEIIKCVWDGLRWTDIYYILCTCLFFFLIKKVQPVKKLITKVLITLMIMVVVDICSYLIYCSLAPERRYFSFFIHRMEHRHMSAHLQLCDPNNAVFRRGCIRTLSYEFILGLIGTVELTEKQKVLIAKKIEEVKKNNVNRLDVLSKDNVIFILVESYTSFTSDMKVNGKEVTPFLNSLKRDSTVYYNGKMHENVTIGESSDGQFIYMTGLLPLRSVITVSKALDVTLPGLPKMLNRKSRMVIPTVPSMWNQDDMCRQYGFNEFYSSMDYTGGHTSLNDEQVFQLAMQKDKESRLSFFSVIITMTMHQPYTKQIDPTFLITDPSIPKDMACYLNACHYTDHQIENYFEHLKKIGIYDNSLIVIVADHSIRNTDIGSMSKDIPLYLVNIPSEIKSKMWTGECNQIDVYTTLLNLLGIESEWYGLGESLLSPYDQNTIDAKTWDFSEWIIRGNYFSPSGG